LSFASFIAGRITFRSKRTFSKMIVRIAVFGIMLGLGVMILSLAIVKGFKQEIREKIRGFSGDFQIIKLDLNNSFENSAFSIDSDFVKKAKSSEYITSISPCATKPGIIKANDEVEGVVFKGIDKSYDAAFLKKNLVSGRLINFADSTHEQILISSFTANRLKLKTGDDFLMYFVQKPLRKRKFEIVGIFNIGVDEVDKTFVIGNLALLRRLNNWKPTDVGGYELGLKKFDDIKAAQAYLDDVMPTQLRAYSISDTYRTIFDWLGLIDVNAQVMLILMIMVAVINMISALLIMILERTTMIGMMKAMGATNWTIQKIFLYNAFYLIGYGLILGNVFGVGIGVLQHHTHILKLDQASYYMNFVPIQLELQDVLMLNMGTLLICLLVMLLPSMLVSRISPLKAIRFK
jgi:lipoprotein-releasing system permease protein